MCVFDINENMQEFQYDVLFTGGESVCSKNCLGNGTCEKSECKCQPAFGGESCEVGISELQLTKELEMIVDPGNYLFFKVAKGNVKNSASVNFKISSKNTKSYVVKDTSASLPSAQNTLKVISLESNGDSGVGFIPQDEIIGFDKDDYDFLIFSKRKF